MKPIDMVLHCPNCGMQHIDAPESDEDYRGKHLAYGGFDNQWTNPPHKSHLCHGCRCVWRPADVATNGVVELKTRGKDDTWPAVHNDEVRAMPAGVPVVRNATRCGYCGQDMIPGSECSTSTDASACAMYDQYSATHKRDTDGVTEVDRG